MALDYMAECRDLVLDEIRRFVPHGRRSNGELYDLLFDYPLRQAKGLRPALCVATCRALSGSLEGVLPSAAVLELYHNAFLIHDDVEDGSEKRRGAPTLHRRHGVPIAVNVGDAMLAIALRPLLENTRLLGLGKALRVLDTVARMAVESAEGQALELSWVRTRTWALRDADYLRMVHKKTGVYTFLTPVVVGGVVAGAAEAQLVQLRRFATALGSAFQIQDDILNVSGSEGAYGKEIAGDLWEGKHTLLLGHALRSATSAERSTAARILSRRRPPSGAGPESLRPLQKAILRLSKAGELSERGAAELTREVSRARRREKSEHDVVFLLSLLHKYGSIEYARSVARKRARRAAHTLERLDVSLSSGVHRDFLHALTRFVVEREQ